MKSQNAGTPCTPIPQTGSLNPGSNQCNVGHNRGGDVNQKSHSSSRPFVVFAYNGDYWHFFFTDSLDSHLSLGTLFSKIDAQESANYIFYGNYLDIWIWIQRHLWTIWTSFNYVYMYTRNNGRDMCPLLKWLIMLACLQTLLYFLAPLACTQTRQLDKITLDFTL